MVPPPPRARWRRLRRALCVELGLLTLLIAPVAYLFAAPDNPTGLRLVLVGGPSMQPLLGTMNVLLMRQTTRFARLDVAQVRRDGIHRIVGLPGETVWVRGGHICVAARPGTQEIQRGRCLIRSATPQRRRAGSRMAGFHNADLLPGSMHRYGISLPSAYVTCAGCVRCQDTGSGGSVC